MNIIRKRITRLALPLALVLLAGIAAAQPQQITDLRPTVMLISIDGFRYDYFEKYKPTNLSRLSRNGVRAKWLIPVFPSLTFPNHYSVATGLYPENHGIVANTMYDPDFRATFSLSKREEVENSRWWKGEPIWVTAEKQGLRAAAFFFPGTEAEIAGKRPTFWKTYDGSVPNFDRVDQILAWLDLPQAERPRIFTLYFSDVDSAGHDFAPGSREVGRAVAAVDASIGRLLAGLKARGIEEKVNLVIVSDHGMAPVKPRSIVILDDYFDSKKAEVIAWSSSLVGVFPRPGEDDGIYRSLTAKSLRHVKCYRKGEIPERLHYRNNGRIAPLVCMADEGWRLMSRERYENDKREGKLPTRVTGQHGYDNQLKSMRAIFVGHGEAFKSRAVIEPFEAVHVYHIMTGILRLTPAPNDGTPAVALRVLR